MRFEAYEIRSEPDGYYAHIVYLDDIGDGKARRFRKSLGPPCNTLYGAMDQIRDDYDEEGLNEG